MQNFFTKTKHLYTNRISQSHAAVYNGLALNIWAPDNNYQQFARLRGGICYPLTRLTSLSPCTPDTKSVYYEQMQFCVGFIVML